MLAASVFSGDNGDASEKMTWRDSCLKTIGAQPTTTTTIFSETAFMWRGNSRNNDKNAMPYDRKYEH
jgi:hypothetical protein